ncbi:gene transfer agent family protein [Brucella anthropi]|uniref:gene transfer agent family protein n=1 Tax=Brucella anthropi TaxID=529 RepID=UPI003671B835
MSEETKANRLRTDFTIQWGDGEYKFQLRGMECQELERVCGEVGIGEIHRRVTSGNWFFNDLKETIRLGLIGGGTGAVKARQLVDMYVSEAALASNEDSPEALAVAILNALWYGVEYAE